MLKLFVKLMLLMVVLALAGPFFIKGPDGTPLIGYDDLRRKFVQARGHIANRWHRLTDRYGSGGDPVPVYRWQDEDGNWHFSDSANPDGASELLYVDPDRNVVPTGDPGGAQERSDPIPPPQGIEQLLDEAHDATQSLEDRNEEIGKRIQEER